MFSSHPGPPQTKSERTRAHLRAIALRSFRERGYDATTIRLIAQEAGVSVGTTHYHFAGKSQLVQELYLDVQERHRTAAAARLADAQDVIARLRAVYETGLDELQPYHEHASEFVSAAMAPGSDINPLGEDSSPARAITEGIFAEAVAGSTHPLPDDIAADLPRALFIAYLLLALYWVYDTSPGQWKTRRILDGGLRLLRSVLPLARLPLVRRPIADLLALIGDVSPARGAK